MAAACELSNAGIEVMLLEARRNLGGRAYSFRDAQTGLLLDNCQHVLLGCCDEAIGFLTRIGSIDLVEFRGAIELIGKNNERMQIEASALPAPLHLLPSILKTRYLSSRDKLDLSTVMARVVMREPGKGASVRDYLDSISCSEKLVEGLIEPILISALNEDAKVASAKYARMVLLKTLLESKRGYRLGVPRAPLAKLIEEPARAFLEQRGSQVHTGARVRDVKLGMHGVESIVLDDGDQICSDIYIFAVPPHALRAMGFDAFGGEQLIWKPIVGAHLFFNSVIPEFDAKCITDEPFQWVFNKSHDFGCSPGYVQAVASAADNIAGLDNSELTRLAMNAVCRAAPELGSYDLTRSLICRYTRATFSTGGISDTYRPPTATPIENAFLAGDWTDTHWPATIEGAVRSGRTAARAAMANTRISREKLDEKSHTVRSA